MRKSILFFIVFTVCCNFVAFGQNQVRRKVSNNTAQNDQANANQTVTATETPKPVEQAPIEQPKPAGSNQPSKEKQDETNWNKWSAIGTIASAITGMIVFIFILIQARISYNALLEMQRQVGIMQTQNDEMVRQNNIMDAQTTTMSKQLDVMANQSETMQKQTEAMKEALERTDTQIEQNAQLIKASERQVETALRQYELTDRPWLAVDAKITSPLTFSDGGVSLEFMINAKNVGRSVAINATITAQMFVDETNEQAISIIKKQEKLCENVHSYFLSYAIFPEQSFPLHIISGGSKDDVEKGKVGEFIFLYIVGCVDYQISGHNTHHQTRFLYEVVRIVENPPRFSRFIPLGEDVPLEFLTLHKALIAKSDYAD